MENGNYIVEVELSQNQLKEINKLLSLTYSKNARKVKPKTSLLSLIRAVENKQITTYL